MTDSKHDPKSLNLINNLTNILAFLAFLQLDPCLIPRFLAFKGTVVKQT